MSIRHNYISSAFLREGDSENLRDVPPNVTALLTYLRREYRDQYSREVYDMSDGFSYMLNDSQQWQIILD